MIILLTLFFLAVAVAICIMFISNLVDTVRYIQPKNQKIDPMRVWRILIPVYNLFWLFVVVTKISESIYAEYQDRNIEIPQKPTYTTGIVYAISILLNTLFSISKLINDDLKQNPVFQLLTGLNALTGVAFWIAYWIQTAQYKSQIKQFVGRDTL